MGGGTGQPDIRIQPDITDKAHMQVLYQDPADWQWTDGGGHQHTESSKGEAKKLQDDILSMKKFDLNDPKQAVEAQEKLLFIREDLRDAYQSARIPFGVVNLSYTDPNSRQTILAGVYDKRFTNSSLNDLINAIDKQNAPSSPAPAVAPQQPKP